MLDSDKAFDAIDKIDDVEVNWHVLYKNSKAEGSGECHLPISILDNILR